MVQHILPKRFHRMRYYGLHATCKAKKVKVVLKELMVALGRLLKGTYRGAEDLPRLRACQYGS